MRLAEGIKVDIEKTLGELKFSAKRRVVYERNEGDTQSKEIKERTYDLRSRGQEMMIQVSIPGELPEKEIEFNTVVELVNPTFGAIATNSFPQPEVDWYIKADDIIIKKATSNQPTG